MSADDEKWWEAQCGEYVLGTLRGADRDVLERILEVDSDVAAHVTYWEKTLGPLEYKMKAVQPPEHVFASVMEKIREQAPAGKKEAPATTEKKEAPATTAREKSAPGVAADLTGTWTEDIDSVLATDAAAPTASRPREPGTSDITWSDTAQQDIDYQYHHDKLPPPNTVHRLWKWMTLIPTLAALLLAGLLWRQVTQDVVRPFPIPASGSLSVLLDSQQQALWLVTVVHETSQTTILALAPPPLLPEQSHQLWIVKPDDTGIVSAGLLPRASGQSRTTQLPLPIEQAEQFAVSLEPATGSPDELPTGPVLFSGVIQQLGQ